MPLEPPVWVQGPIIQLSACHSILEVSKKAETWSMQEGPLLVMVWLWDETKQAWGLKSSPLVCGALLESMEPSWGSSRLAEAVIRGMLLYDPPLRPHSLGLLVHSHVRSCHLLPPPWALPRRTEISQRLSAFPPLFLSGIFVPVTQRTILYTPSLSPSFVE